MDPERAASGFTRSLVLATGASGVVPAGPVGGAGAPPGGWEIVLPPAPTPAPDAFALGASPGTPTIAGMPLAGATVELGLPVEVPPDVALGTTYQLGTRWIPLDGPAAVEEPVALLPSAAGDGEDAAIAIVAPEASAARVDVVAATVRDGVIAAPVDLPPSSGRYRLEVTVHGADGVALPYAVQSSIPAVVAHVGGPGAAWIDAPPTVSATAGTRASIQVLVTNGEADPWGACAAPERLPTVDAVDGCPVVRLVGRWLPLTGDEGAPAIARTLTVPAASGATTWLAGPVPAAPGTYLLIASLERSVDGGPATVLGRPVAITVEVAAAPLVPPSPSSGG